MTRTLSRQSKFNLSPTLPSRLDGAGVDSYAANAIHSVRDVLAASIWPDPDAYGEPREDGAGAAVSTSRSRRTQDGERKAAQAQDDRRDRPSLESLMKVMLGKSIVELAKSEKDKLTLSQALRKDDQWGLYLQADHILEGEGLPLNANALFEHDAIRQYVFAKAVYVHGLDEPEAIAAFMGEEVEADGLAGLYHEVVSRAAQAVILEEKIEIGDEDAFKKYLDERVIPVPLSFVTGSFSRDLRDRIERYAHHAALLKHIEEVDQALGLEITPDELNQLIAYVQRSGIDLDHLETVQRTQFIFNTITKFRDAATTNLVTTDEPLSPLDFTVRYHSESSDAQAVNTNNVLCAAQLFYVMTTGDELGVFDAADLLVRKYLSRSLVDIQSQKVLRDLQNYALNDEFPDLTTGRMYKRTGAEERQMFYRQVFDFGGADVMDGMVTNQDFDGLWHNLMIEDARYITAIRQSESPELYVSREGITQAMEALQYNLSTHCSGMAKVMTPVMYKELDFLIERIFKSEEIIAQLALHNSRSYMKVIERILQEEYQRGINVSALRKKAADGHAIIENIAKYNQAMIGDDAKFSNFVRLVYAFITTGEKLEESNGGLFERQEADLAPTGVNGNGNVDFGADDWNF